MHGFKQAVVVLFFVFCVWSCGVVGCSRPGGSVDGGNPETSAIEKAAPKALLFPKGFMWGVSIAGFQGEMGCPTLPAAQCEDHNSDWYQWVTNKEILATKSTGLDGNSFPLAYGDPVSWGPGQWELYDKDFEMAKVQLGVKAFRMGIEWSRIFPTSTVGVEGHDNLKKIANLSAIKRYREMFQALRKRGMEPYVTLNHYTLPLWIHDGVACHKNIETCRKKGWANPKVFLPEIVKYSGFVAKEFGADVDFWLTINEPFAVILPGYLFQVPDRVNPPAVRLKYTEARTVLLAMIEAHAKMYDAVKKNDTIDANNDGKVALIGIPYSFSPVYPKDPKRALDVEGAKKLSYLLNDVFMQAINLGKFDAKLDGKTVDRPDLANRCDYIGVNYYEKTVVTGADKSILPLLSPMFTVDPFSLKNIGFFPKGLYDLLMLVKKYKKPILITENGYKMEVAPKAKEGAKADDSKMSEFMLRHLFWLHKAIQDGADVKGYLFWSLVDNYEWNHGFNLRFGLYGYDPKDKAKKRIPRAGVAAYQQVIKTNGLLLDVITPLLSKKEREVIKK